MTTEGNMSELVIPVTPALVSVISRPKPFSDHRVRMQVEAGQTLEQIVEQVIHEPWLRQYAVVTLEGQLVPQEWLRSIRPKPGRQVDVMLIPGNSGGGEGGAKKNTWAIVLSVVVIAAAAIAQAYWASYALAPASGISAGGAALGATGIGLASAGTLMAINGLLPPPRPPRGAV
jgi:predicted phage tail protein